MKRINNNNNYNKIIILLLKKREIVSYSVRNKMNPSYRTEVQNNRGGGMATASLNRPADYEMYQSKKLKMENWEYKGLN